MNCAYLQEGCAPVSAHLLAYYAQLRNDLRMPNTTTGTDRNPTKVDGAQLRRRRIEAGLTIRTLAAMASSTLSHLSDIERGRRNPSPPLLVRLAAALDIDTTALLHPEAPRVER